MNFLSGLKNDILDVKKAKVDVISLVLILHILSARAINNFVSLSLSLCVCVCLSLYLLSRHVLLFSTFMFPTVSHSVSLSPPRRFLCLYALLFLSFILSLFSHIFCLF
jgi:hypothetical protein